MKRLLLLLLVAALAGCGGDDGDGGGSEAQESECVTQGSAQLPELEEGKTYRLAFKTNQGDFTIELDREKAPCTSASFVSLTEKGFFNGLTFHRIVPGFVIQGGDPKGDGSGGPGYTIKAEFNKQAHQRGTVAMARTNDPDSAGSQFYICFKPAPFLDGKYTVFGRVVKGMEVVDRIQVGDRMKSVKINEPTK